MGMSDFHVIDERLNHIASDWPDTIHVVRHECGYIVSYRAPHTQRACDRCPNAWDAMSYEDTWVWE